MTETIWDRRFRKEGHIWGDNPSLSALFLAALLKQNSSVFEIGYGYGRDLLYFAQQGHNVSGIDESSEGCSEARELLETEGFDASGVVQGDFNKAVLSKNAYDAVLSHRVLHLLTQERDIERFRELCSLILRPGGLLTIAARDPRDFDPKTMRMNDDGTAEYIDRPGHIISFWDEERFKKVFGNDFVIKDIKKREEPESSSKDTHSYLTTMIARKKYLRLPFNL